jgi:predicted enzyme related to lactoylglutathione lyase
MITGVKDVYYNVEDMGRSIAFYRDVLGLTVTDEDPHFTGFNVGGVRFGLHWTGGSPVPAIPHDAHGSHTGGTLTFQVADIHAAKQSLESHKVPILGFSENPWGSLLTFTDPDGNVLKMAQPPLA